MLRVHKLFEMKKGRGFVNLELPLGLAILGLLLISSAFWFRETAPTLGWFVFGVGALLCLPLLGFL